MEGKNFFKLSWLKIAILLIVLLSVFLFLTYDNGIRCIRAPCPSQSTGTFLQYFNSQPHHLYSVDYLLLLIGIAVSYLISCTMAFLIEKLLKEKI